MEGMTLERCRIIMELLEEFDACDTNPAKEQSRSSIIKKTGAYDIYEATIRFNEMVWWPSLYSLIINDQALRNRFEDVDIIWLPTLIPQMEVKANYKKNIIVYHLGTSHLLSFIYEHLIVSMLIDYIAGTPEQLKKLKEEFDSFRNMALDAIIHKVGATPDTVDVITPHLRAGRDKMVNDAILFLLYHELGHFRCNHFERFSEFEIIQSQFVIAEQTPTRFMQMEFEADNYAVKSITEDTGSLDHAHTGVGLFAVLSDCEEFMGYTSKTHPLRTNRFINILMRNPELKDRFRDDVTSSMAKKYEMPDENEKKKRIEIINKFSSGGYLSHYLYLMDFIVKHSRKGNDPTSEELDDLIVFTS